VWSLVVVCIDIYVSEEHGDSIYRENETMVEIKVKIVRMVSSGMLRRVALIRTDVLKEPSASIRLTRIGELGTTQASTSN
jgi:hypothetical protein